MVAFDRALRLHHTTSQHRVAWVDELTGDGQTEPTQQTEAVEVGRRELMLRRHER